MLVLGDFLETRWAFLPAQISLIPALFVALFLGSVLVLLIALALLRGLIGILTGAAPALRLRAFAVVALLAALGYVVTPSRYDLGSFPLAGTVAETAWRNARYVWDAKGISGRYLAEVQAE